jgi:ACR3 family arsenite efflux pump ArsB
MPAFERYLTLWATLCIVAGVAFGHAVPGVVQAIGAAEIAKVNLPVAVLIWLMIIPMLSRIDFAALGQVGCHWRGIGVTLLVNWAVKPFSMAALGGSSWAGCSPRPSACSASSPGQRSLRVVGVPIEVPVMLSVGAIVNRSKDWYERGLAQGTSERAAP